MLILIIATVLQMLVKKVIKRQACLIEAKSIEIFTLLRVDLKKTAILKQLSVSRVTVLRVEQRLKVSESRKDSPRSRRPQVINQEIIKWPSNTIYAKK